jgi:saccharopine dehydrogenase-like NADP-dependent oxidoreductase
VLDYYHTDTETSSMARTTGYTCTAMVHLIAEGQWSRPGLAPPEIIGRQETCFSAILAHLKDREVHVFHDVQEI